MIIFELYTKPAPQKQTRFFKAGNHLRAYDPSHKEKEQIQWQIKHEFKEEPLLCPIKMELSFFLPVPKSKSKIKTRQMINHVILPITKPDVDNLAYLVTNALKGIVYKDDSQIVDLILHKRYASEPRTLIKITPIINFEQAYGDKCE